MMRAYCMQLLFRTHQLETRLCHPRAVVGMDWTPTQTMIFMQGGNPKRKATTYN